MELTTTITPTTELFTLTKSFDGYTLKDLVLGSMSEQEYSAAGDDGAASICELMVDYVRDEAIFLSHASASKAQDEKSNGYTYAITQFTPIDLHNEIMHAARNAE